MLNISDNVTRLRQALIRFLSCFAVFGLGVLPPLSAETETNGPQPSNAGEWTDVAASETRFFESEIRPVLIQQCLKCHGPEKQEGELRLDSRDAMLKGGEQGPALVPGDSHESLLVSALRHETLEMPPSGKLPEKTIAKFARWIQQGASWPEQLELRPATKQITADDLDWWAFRPIVRPDVPMAKPNASTHPIDAFVTQKLKAKQMVPAPPADRRTLIRRLYFDLIGLPPSPDEIEAFVNDTAPDAWPRLIDRLLEDPRYGEHWARFWLDVVRYAESDGWNQDAYRPQIWRYRDYVVDAFNQDKPYSQFVREQLAGDMFPDPDEAAWAATGYLRLGIYEYNQRNARQQWTDIVNEVTDVTGDVFFGMSVACARCHDHKFDPLLQTDYYRLRAYFEPIIWQDDVTAATSDQRSTYEDSLGPWQEATTSIRAEIDALKKPYHDKKWEFTVDKFPLEIQACFRTPADQRDSWQEQMAYLVRRQFFDESGGPLAKISKADRKRLDDLEAKLAEFDSLKPKTLPHVMSVKQYDGRHTPTTIPGKSEPIDAQRFELFSVMLGVEREPENRLQLAEWIVSRENPVSLRVIVNRVWQQHFGAGLVRTSNDFGHSGARPSHPDLLDWLTVEFIDGGLCFKPLHRKILTSATWRQAAHHPQAADYEQLDPTEQLLWRAPVRRLSAEQIRDAMLCVSGELDAKRGGPSVAVDVARRSLYVKRKRNNPERMLHTFDAANGLKSVSQRNQTTTPTQALMLFNSKFPRERARQFAARLLEPAVLASGDPIQAAFVMAWGRAGTNEEQRQARRFLKLSEPDADGRPELERMTEFCHVLLNSNEFLYLD